VCRREERKIREDKEGSVKTSEDLCVIRKFEISCKNPRRISE
jgi:hypothetical protein